MTTDTALPATQTFHRLLIMGHAPDAVADALNTTGHWYGREGFRAAWELLTVAEQASVRAVADAVDGRLFTLRAFLKELPVPKPISFVGEQPVVVMIESDTTPGTFYRVQVWRDGYTVCACKGYKNHHHCKHEARALAKVRQDVRRAA